jgi:hypothetical protein
VYLQIIAGANCTGLLGLAMGWIPQPIPMLLIIALATSFVLVGMVRVCRYVENPKSNFRAIVAGNLCTFVTRLVDAEDLRDLWVVDPRRSIE